jgi:hypothetical protein
VPDTVVPLREGVVDLLKIDVSEFKTNGTFWFTQGAAVEDGSR